MGFVVPLRRRHTRPYEA